MNYRYLIAMLLALGVFSFIAPSLLVAQSESITLNNVDAYSGKDRAAVVFPHELHAEAADCGDCHHSFKGGEDVMDPSELGEEGVPTKCASCHGADKAPEGYDEAETPLREAFHEQCWACHSAMDQKGEKTGPRTCVGCHGAEQ